jgi:hypothetical protein
MEPKCAGRLHADYLGFASSDFTLRWPIPAPIPSSHNIHSKSIA